jgi:hypothetical protein
LHRVAANALAAACEPLGQFNRQRRFAAGGRSDNQHGWAGFWHDWISYGDSRSFPAFANIVMQPSSAASVIELRLRSLSQLFNSMDPSPFHEKDLDDDAEEFVVGWAMELPKDRPVRLIIHVEASKEDSESAGLVADAVNNFFRYKSRMKARELRDLLRRGRVSLVIGLLFVAGCFGVVQSLGRWGDYTVIQVVRESFLIGGWVALWRPLEIYLYDWWPLVRMRQLYDRLGEAEVVLKRSEPAE